MRTGICLVTTWNREELLFLCLEAIRKADSDMPVYVFSDRGANSQELTDTCNHFGVCKMPSMEHKYFGNSFNLLNACRTVTGIPMTDYPLNVHLVEDDTIIHPDWFSWSRLALRSAHVRTIETGFRGASTGRNFIESAIPEYAAVCARTNDSKTIWYESPAASWNAEYLRQALTLIPKDYFSDTREGMQKAISASPHFLKSKYRYGSPEQDGFFMRCIEKFGWKTAFPPKCMATHLGAWGYNRGEAERPQGSLEERVFYCRQLLADKERRIALFGQKQTEAEMEGTA